MRTRRGLRMVLNSEKGQLSVPQSFYRVIIEVKVCHLKFLGTRDVLSRSPYSKSVVLARYENLTRLKLSNRVISPAVAVGELQGLAAKRESDELVAKTNPEGW